MVEEVSETKPEVGVKLKVVGQSMPLLRKSWVMTLVA
jgi:hypothetical protein